VERSGERNRARPVEVGWSDEQNEELQSDRIQAGGSVAGSASVPARVQSHVAVCESCRSELNELKGPWRHGCLDRAGAEPLLLTASMHG